VGKVIVTVIGSDGKPAAGRTVHLLRSERRERTDAEGKAVFDATPAGWADCRLEPVGDGSDVEHWSDFVWERVEVSADRACELELVMPRRTTSVTFNVRR